MNGWSDREGLSGYIQIDDFNLPLATVRSTNAVPAGVQFNSERLRFNSVRSSSSKTSSSSRPLWSVTWLFQILFLQFESRPRSRLGAEIFGKILRSNVEGFGQE